MQSPVQWIPHTVLAPSFPIQYGRTGKMWWGMLETIRGMGTASSKLQLHRLCSYDAIARRDGEDFMGGCEIRSVIEKVNWQQLFILFPDTNPKDYKMKQGGSRSWRGDSFSLTLLSFSLQNIVDAESPLEFGTGHSKFTNKDPLRTIKYKGTAFNWGSSRVTSCWRLGEYLGENQHVACLPYFYRLTKAWGIGYCWVDVLAWCSSSHHVRDLGLIRLRKVSLRILDLRSDWETSVGDVPW